MNSAISRALNYGALVLTVFVLGHGTAFFTSSQSANAQLMCPPGFEHLPGCGGGEEGDYGEPEPGKWTTIGRAGMQVEIYLPQTEPRRAGKRALMISLHGCLQKNTVIASAGNWKSTADEYGMVVAAPAAPNGGVILGCWDYYDTNHSRSNPSRHDDNLLDLVNSLLANPTLNIDHRQVYISGLSSGGGQSMVMGCLAPDVFAGIGLNAGPTVGTGSGEIGYVATDLIRGRQVCQTFAGNNASAFDTQLTSVIYGSNDSTVAPGYNELNARIMANIYGATSESTQSLQGLPGNNTQGTRKYYSDANGPRVSLIQNTGIGHNWPAGGGAGGSYVTANSINYPAYVTSFFFENNRRLEPDGDDITPPSVSITAPTDGATVSGVVPVAVNATDNVGVTYVELYVNGNLVGTDSTAPYEFSWDTGNVGDGTHVLTARAYDAANNRGSDEVEVHVGAGGGLFCGSATNLQHLNAGRAISWGNNPYNPYYAVGSNAYLGMGDATVTVLKETSQGYFVQVSSCQ